jgi:hypothetical protein
MIDGCCASAMVAKCLEGSWALYYVDNPAEVRARVIIGSNFIVLPDERAAVPSLQPLRPSVGETSEYLLTPVGSDVGGGLVGKSRLESEIPLVSPH